MHPQGWPAWLQWLIGIPLIFLGLAVYSWFMYPVKGLFFLAVFSNRYTRRERLLSGMLIGLVMVLAVAAAVHVGSK
jgi:hypothetical protein